MMSCEDNFELTKLSCYLANIYGPKLAMHLGNKHDYLGMDFEFMDNGRRVILSTLRQSSSLSRIRSIARKSKLWTAQQE